MKQIVNVNLTTKSTDWTPPVLSFGEELTLVLYFQKTINGNSAVPNLNISGGKAAIGYVDARPAGGPFKLWLGSAAQSGSNVTSVLQYNAVAKDVAAAINALGTITGQYGTCTAQAVDGSWLLHFGDGSQLVPIQGVQNGLWPVAGVLVNAWQVNNRWVHEVRLTQMPLVFTSNYTLSAAQPPSVTEIRQGQTNGSALTDELQQLYLPPDFQGSYTLSMGSLPTAQIAPTAAPSDIQAALIAAFGSTFTVTLPQNFNFLIDFGGQYAGVPQSNLVVAVTQPSPTALEFTLNLNTAALASALRRRGGAVTVPLEVRFTSTEDNETTASEVVAFAIPVTINPPVSWPSMEELSEPNWAQPLSPVAYTPFGAENVLTTGQVWAGNQGDGSATSFAIVHGLATEDVFTMVRDNSTGQQLVCGTDYSATVNSTGQVTVASLVGAPTSNQWRILIFSAFAVAQWAAGLTVTEEQVQPSLSGVSGSNLVNDLESIETRLSNLETLLPGQASTTNTSSALATAFNPFTIAVPPASGFLFAKDASGNPITAAANLNTRGGYLLPAINKAAADAAYAAQSPTAGALYSLSAATSIPAGGGIRSSLAQPNGSAGAVGSDGRINYPVSQSGSSSSYFPTPFELTLFEMYFNDRMFSVGTTLTVLFKLALQLLNADTECQWVIVIEKGAFTADTSPGTPDPANLADVVWDVTDRLLVQRLILTQNLETHGFGCTIANNSGVATVSAVSGGTVTVASTPPGLVVGATFLGQLVTAIAGTTITLAADATGVPGTLPAAVPFASFGTNGLYYQRVIAAAVAAWPTCATFALRARLINFDTKDSVADARGWVSWALQAPDNATLGATITVPVAGS